MPRFLYIAIGIAAFLLLILILAIAGVGRREAKPQPATLQFWGFEDDQEVWRGVIEAFRKQYPHIDVSYRRLPERTYEETLVNSLAEGKGPDLFLLRNTALDEHRDKIFPLPRKSSPFTPVEMARTFVDDPAGLLMTEGGDLLGLPIFVDSLALFYNKDIFAANGIAQAPRTWDEAAALSQHLTTRAENGDLVRSGLALGGSDNIAHAMEIVSAFIFQRGDAIVRGNAVALGEGAIEALAFYTSFADSASQNFSWTNRMLGSLDAFAEGKAAMAIGFAADSDRIRAKNPHANFGVAPLPQLSGARAPRTYAQYWFPAVSRLSKAPQAAWQFIFYAAYPEGAELYRERAGGRPPARRDQISRPAKTEEEDVFSRQALTAHSWQIPDEDAAPRLFEEAIESVISRAMSPAGAIGRLREQLQLYLR